MEAKKKKRIVILKEMLSKSNTIMDDIVMLMMHIYSTPNSVLQTNHTTKYQELLAEQLKE